MIEHARSAYPRVDFHIADMREFRLDRRFDAVMSLGSGLNYMLTNRELEQALETFRVHCNEGALLIVEPLNSSSFVGSNSPPTEFEVDTGEGRARARAEYTWHPATQILERQRIWEFENGSDPVKDSFKLRLLFSRELTYFLEMAGFQVLDIFERQRSSVYAKSLYPRKIS